MIKFEIIKLLLSKYWKFFLKHWRGCLGTLALVAVCVGLAWGYCYVSKKSFQKGYTKANSEWSDKYNDMVKKENSDRDKIQQLSADLAKAKGDVKTVVVTKVEKVYEQSKDKVYAPPECIANNGFAEDWNAITDAGEVK